MDVISIRRKNLNYLVKQEKSAKVFATKIDMSQSQLSQLRSNSNPKQIGNSIARSIEEKLGFVKGWMDQLHEETLTPEDIAEISMINAGFNVAKRPKDGTPQASHAWSAASFVVTRDNDDLQVFVDIYSKLYFDIPIYADNIKNYVYIEQSEVNNAGKVLLDHFKKWCSAGVTGVTKEDELLLIKMFRSQNKKNQTIILKVVQAFTEDIQLEMHNQSRNESSRADCG